MLRQVAATIDVYFFRCPAAYSRGASPRTDRKLHVQSPAFVALVFDRLCPEAHASAHCAALTSVIIVD
jgi:hypothetical protein